MKKFLVACAVLVAMSAHASPDWFVIDDGSNGARLLGKKGSMSVRKNSSDALTVAATFAWVDKAGELVPFVAATLVESCINGGGSIAMGLNDDFRKYWWTTDGPKMYDVIGTSLCTALKAEANDSARPGPGNI